MLEGQKLSTQEKPKLKSQAQRVQTGSFMKKRAWTLEQRLQHAEQIRQQGLWQYSTGPKTTEGKNISKMNTYKHGIRTNEVGNLAKAPSERGKKI